MKKSHETKIVDLSEKKSAPLHQDANVSPAGKTTFVGSWKRRAFLFFLIFVFVVLWGGSGLFNKTEDIFIIHDKIVIRSDEFFRAFKRVVDSQRNQDGSPMQLSKNDKREIATNVLRGLFYRKVVELEVKSLGLDMSEDKIINMIASDQMFMDEDKRFSREMFLRFLSYMGMSESEYIQTLKMSFLVNQLLSAYRMQINLPKSMMELAYKSIGQERTAEYIIISFKDSVIMAPTQEEQRVFFMQSRQLFQSPAGRSFRMIYIPNKNALNKINKTENSKKIDKSSKKKPKVSNAMQEEDFSKLNKDLLAQVEDSSLDLSDIAKNLNLSVISVDFIDEQGLAKDKKSIILEKYSQQSKEEILKSLFSCEIGETTIVNTEEGIFVIQVDKNLDESLMEYEEAEGLVKDAMVSIRKRSVALEKASKIEKIKGKIVSCASPNMEKYDDEIKSAIQRNAFYMEESEISYAEIKDGVVVLKLISIKEVDIKKDIKERIDAAIEETVWNDLLDSYVQILIKKHGVNLEKVNNKMVEKIIDLV